MSSDEESPYSQKPMLKPEPERGGSGRPPRKTALGYFAYGDDDSHISKPNFHFGQRITVRTMSTIKGGYKVKIKDTEIEAVLETDKTFSLNIFLIVVFRDFTKSGTPIFALSSFDHDNQFQGTGDIRLFNRTKSEDSNFKFRRLSDSLPVSFDSYFEQIDFEEINCRKFLESISVERFSGFITFSSGQLLARGFLIMFEGRCVGADYRCASEPFERRTEESIFCLIDGFAAEDSLVQKHSVQREIAFALSIPYIGVYDSWHLRQDTELFAQFVLERFSFKPAKTGLIWFNSSDGPGWAIFFEGEFIGFFDIEKQSFKNDFDFLKTYIEHSKDLDMQTFVLKRNMVGRTNNLGFDLSESLL